MSGTAPRTRGSVTDAQHAWVLSFLNIDSKSPPTGAPGGGGPGDGSDVAPGDGAPAGERGALKATDADIFFDQDSPVLTTDDKNSLDKYAKAYADTQSDAAIKIDAYASTDGDANYNKGLSNERAQAVANYLIAQGVPKDKVTAVGHGATVVFSGDDPRQNRRATIKPPPPASTGAQVQTTGTPTPTAKGGSGDDGPHAPKSLGMRGDHQPQTGKDGENRDARKPLSGHELDGRDVKVKPGVARDVVERELEEFLERLAKAQKTKSVKASDKVWMVDSVLHEGLTGGAAPFVKRGDTKDYDPSELAESIAGNLPDFIPQANFDKFQKMKAVDVPDAGSVTDQVKRKFREERDELVHKLPKSLQGVAKKAINAAFAKGVPFVVDKVLPAGTVDTKLKDALQKFVDDYTKQITDDKK